MQDNFSLLCQREIIDILIGDTIIVEKEEYKIQMPYLSGRKLCEISTQFGLNTTYTYNGGALSRWTYMNNLLEYMIEKKRINDLLKYLFAKDNFKQLLSLDTPEKIKNAYEEIIEGIVKKINAILFLSHHELKYINGHFNILELGKKIEIEAPKIATIDMPYIQGLRERCKEDFYAGNYDSVITKSRTLIEEVLIYILEKNAIEVESKGDLGKIYNQVKTLFGMQQNKGYDGRVNSLLSGLERIVLSIAEMRNVNSDAHGAGSKRIEIREHEVLLVMNSAVTFSEYVLSVHNIHKR